eukprot:CAMPEP_0194121672 /NCGR_PEP_ID=MMETSP0150-20130528/47889_1 /TAXON_ID=122233 /ORGANISM="Chaetoceros debilis, Strain MM31A-1" /LENGTH=1084 /DNA_ID=CAMNT_0038814207 /DNA_START=94 /DNA_END=3348 /DNA_ORIENTATION=-
MEDSFIFGAENTNLRSDASSDLSINGDLTASFQSFSSENEEELKNIAATVAPAVTSLFDTNEAALEDLISRNEIAWLEEEDKFRKPGRFVLNRDESDDEEDGINSEWNRLADAEQMLRDELEMSNVGFNFMQFIDGRDTSPNAIIDPHNRRECAATDSTGLIIDENDDMVGLYEDSDSENENARHYAASNDEHVSQEEISPACSDHQIENDDTTSKAIYNTIEKLIQPPSPRKESYTLYDHAKQMGLLFDDADLGYPTCPLLPQEEAENIIDIPVFRHDLITGYIGSFDRKEISEDCKVSNLSRIQSNDTDKREEKIRDISNCTKDFVRPMNNAALQRIFQGINEGNKRSQENDQERKEGNGGGVSIKSSRGDSIDDFDKEMIPVRTVTIQIRPDVLVGAVLDAVYTSVKTLNGEVTKRQGGRLRALVPGKWILEDEYAPFRKEMSNINSITNIFGSPMFHSSPGIMNGMAFLPAFVLDVQLCTKRKSRYAERVLLARFYSITEGQILDNGSAMCPPSPPHAALTHSNSAASTSDFTPAKNMNYILRESASLLQRMRCIAATGGRITFDFDEAIEQGSSVPISKKRDASLVRTILTSPLKMFSPSSNRKESKQRLKNRNILFDTSGTCIVGVDAARNLATDKLVADFNETPSVNDAQDGLDPIASLSPVDWPWLCSSWRFLADCINELDNRDLAFSTLVSCPFGAFPALPTLDVHYCSQIKDICKENMLSSLIKSASELEVYAREAETKCHRLLQIIHPTFASYEYAPPPSIPDAIPVSSYPLDFTPPEVASPPWGQKVVEALNLIAAKSPSINSGFHDILPIKQHSDEYDNVGAALVLSADHVKSDFDKAKGAVSMVLTAFQKQEDEELSARLGRKNCQVMDRLAKMQAFKREAVMAIAGLYGLNLEATKAANKVHEYIKENLNETQEATDSMNTRRSFSASDQVPLLHCRVICHGSPGVIYVTYNELLLVTQNIPLLGGNYITHAFLNEIMIDVKEVKKSRLNPMPSMIIVRSKNSVFEELFSFRPSSGARLFKEFIDTLTDIKSESPDAIDFNSKGGLLYMFGQKEVVAKAALGNKEDMII